MDPPALFSEEELNSCEDIVKGEMKASNKLLVSSVISN